MLLPPRRYQPVFVKVKSMGGRKRTIVPDHVALREPNHSRAFASRYGDGIEQRRQQLDEESAPMDGAFEQQQVRLAQKGAHAGASGQVQRREIVRMAERKAGEAEGAGKLGRPLAQRRYVLVGVMQLGQQD